MEDLKSDELWEWFKIGKTVRTKVKTGLGATGGYGGIRVETPEAAEERDLLEYLPSYLKPSGSGREYVHKYLKQEQESLQQHIQETDAAVGGVNEIEDVTLTSDVANVADLDDVAVYQNYNFNHTFDFALPIHDKLEEIIHLTESYDAVVIEGPTGCGKTTQVPQYIMDHYVATNKPVNIVVTQPRRIAAISVAKRVASERNWQLGDLVGYQVGLDHEHKSRDTRLLYVTTGVLIKKLISRKNMNEFTHIIIDEVHERDINVDFLLLLVKKLLRSNSRNVKVILMSATIDSQRFAEYFASPWQGMRGHLAPIISIEKRLMYSVAEYHLDELCDLNTESVDITMDVPNREQLDKLYNLSRELIKAFDRMEGESSRIRGSVLVFLPGEEQITRMHGVLDEIRNNYRLHLHILHSKAPIDIQKSVFNAPPHGFRKVILSTNIAESSITVPDIKYVIDFCLTKNLVLDKETNYEYLNLQWASHVNCKQRKGRAGRVSDGEVYRLVPRWVYEKYLPEYTEPEMLRVNLSRLILNVKKLGMGEPKALLALAIDPPHLPDIEKSILNLKQAGALTVLTGDSYDGDLTLLGYVMEALPLDIYLSKLIVLSNLFGCLEYGVIVACGLSVKNIFSRPFHDELGAYSSKLHWDKGQRSDCFAILYAYQTWQRHKREGFFNRPGGLRAKEWARKAFLEYNSLLEMEKLINEVTNTLSKFGIEQTAPVLEEQLEDVKLMFKVILAGAFYPNYYLRSPADEKQAAKDMSGNDPFNCVILHGLPNDYSFLYEDQVKALFAKFKIPVVNVTFENTRAYVEFKRSDEQKNDPNKSEELFGKTNINLYLALKIQSIPDCRRALTLQTLPISEARAKWDLLKLQENCSVLSADARIELAVARPEVPPPELPSEENVVVDIKHLNDASSFWACLSENRTRLEDIQRDISRHSCEMPKFTSTPYIDELVLAPYINLNETAYYRAVVREVTRGTESYEVDLFFIDFGNRTTMLSQDLLKVQGKLNYLWKEPQLVFKCQLARVKPHSITCPNGLWSSKAKSHIESIVFSPRLQQLEACIYSVVHNVVHLDIIAMIQNIDTYVPPTPRDLVAELTANDFGEATEETYLSKQNHQIWKSHGQLVKTTKRNKFPRDVMGFNNYPAIPQKINLRGPFNSLTMTFINVQRGDCDKTVSIDRESINCISIDEEPQDVHDRLLIAAQVTTDSSNNNLSVRGTTQLPNVHGLPSLLAMLFCPYAEIRCDSEFTRYTGVICGLGTLPDSNYPMHPMSDMELMFDIEITIQDIAKIDGIRQTMSSMLVNVGSEEFPKFSTSPGFRRSQANVKNAVKRLLRTPRVSVKSTGFKRRYQWNQVPEQFYLQPNSNCYIQQPVYPLIKPIKLQPRRNKR